MRGLVCGFRGLRRERRLSDHAADTAGARDRKEAGERCGVPTLAAERRRDDGTWGKNGKKIMAVLRWSSVTLDDGFIRHTGGH